MWRFLLLGTLCLICSDHLTAQDLASIGKSRPLDVSGGVSVNQIFYAADGIDSRRDPYSFYASGNVNLSLYGWSCPLSFSYSNQQTSFQQPFNQYSLHPTYKWVTGHLGYTSMSYSPYTVNGHIFLGAGIDAAPEGKWRFSGLYGRFAKAVQPDTTRENPPQTAFQRMGYGFKASYGDGANFADVIVFRAKDDISSIDYIPEGGILPEENLVLSIGGGKTLFKTLLVKAEFATSAITADQQAPETNHDHFLSKITPLFNSRISSSYHNAFKTSVNFQQPGYVVGVGYERIDPQYRTLGAYFFNNDLENITMNGGVALFQGKVNVAVNVGTQRDNLDRSKISSMRRMVSSANVVYAPSQQLNLGVSYSNFQTYTNIRSQFVDINQLTPYDNLDTLNFTQISQNATLTGMYMFGNEQKRQSINMNFTFQHAADEAGEVAQNSGMKFYNMNTAYAINLAPQNMMVSISANVSLNKGGAMDSKTIGPTAALSKSFLDKKLRTTLSSSYNKTYSGTQPLSTIMNARISSSVTIDKKHNINLSMVGVSRETDVEGASKSFKEFTATVGYSYNFSTGQ
jgi:hypothetical protein